MNRVLSIVTAIVVAVSVVVQVGGFGDMPKFFAAAVAMIPLAALMGKATETIAAHAVRVWADSYPRRLATLLN
ncbi:hypothetical protein GCM10025858_04640 [Alicyclobacillus sacchari]|uniref:hypothetical protein n=1 Tax=Alicyclobacillus sacchari TaxID=392010 RepID=UPI0023EA05DE|nr:hypothetical protein [Alicyclobacillus sacchari]GMA55961.1 hypothetical protein GCM10025858_04640 [Alicyclobacillus sacchari]